MRGLSAQRRLWACVRHLEHWSLRGTAPRAGPSLTAAAWPGGRTTLRASSADTRSTLLVESRHASAAAVVAAGGCGVGCSILCWWCWWCCGSSDIHPKASESSCFHSPKRTGGHQGPAGQGQRLEIGLKIDQRGATNGKTEREARPKAAKEVFCRWERWAHEALRPTLACAAADLRPVLACGASLAGATAILGYFLVAFRFAREGIRAGCTLRWPLCCDACQ